MLDGYFPNFCIILLQFMENEKRKFPPRIKYDWTSTNGYFVVIRTKSPVGRMAAVQQILFEVAHCP